MSYIDAKYSNIRHGTEILLNKQSNGEFRLSDKVWNIYIDKMDWDSQIIDGERRAKAYTHILDYIACPYSTARDSIVLIETVKEFGLDESSGDNCKLEIVKIPDNMIKNWSIHEYKDNLGIEYLFDRNGYEQLDVL